MPAISAPDLATLRTFPQAARVGLVVFIPTDAVTAQVDGSPSTGATSISLISIVTTETPDKHYSVWAGSAPGIKDGGKTRLKSLSGATLTVAANNINWASYPYLTIKKIVEPWSIIPDIDNDKEDGDSPYTDENEAFHPLARPGPPYVAFLNGAANVVLNLDGTESRVVEVGTSITGHAWSSTIGSIASPTSATTTITYSAPTQDLIKYTVTCSNGKTHRRYVPVWILESFGDPVDGGYCDVELENLGGNYADGGWTGKVRVFGAATEAEFPEDGFVVIFALDYYGSQQTSVGPIAYRENVIFCGWIVRDTVYRDFDAGKSVSFELVGTAGKMKQLNCWPANMAHAIDPNKWHEVRGMTASLAMFHLVTEHSTIDHLVDIYFAGDGKLIRYIDIPETDLYQQIDEYCAKPVRGRCLSDRYGRMFISRNPNLRPVSERPGIAQVVDLADLCDIRADPGLELGEEEHEYQVAQVDFVGFGYDALDARPWYALAPASQYETGQVEKVDGIRVDDQAEANAVAGLYLAHLNNIWREAKLPLFNWRVFDIVPEEFTIIPITTTDTLRGLDFTADRFICRAMDIDYDPELGRLYTVATFERESSGPAGITGNYPVEPPENPEPDAPPWPPVPPPDEGTINGPLAAFDNTLGFWIRLEGVWYERNLGLSTNQKTMYYGITDPWWKTVEKQNTSDPERAILLAVHQGGVLRSLDAGKNWNDVTPSPNVSATTALAGFGDSPAPAVTDLTYTAIQGDIHTNSLFWALAEWKNPTNEWRGWLLKNTQDGAPDAWQWFTLGGTGGVTDGTYYYADSLLREQDISGPPVDGDVLLDSFTNFLGVDDGIETQFTYDYIQNAGYVEHVVDFDLAGMASGTSMTLEVKQRAEGPGQGYFRYFFNRFPATFVSSDGVTWSANKGAWTVDTTTLSWGPVVNLGSAPFRYIRLYYQPPWDNSFPPGLWDGQRGWIDAIRVANISSISSQLANVRPLGLDVDSETGARIYVTMWADNNLRMLQFGRDGTVVYSTSLSACTQTEMETRDFYAQPFSPHMDATANFGDIVYAYGRFSGPQHVRKSTNGGSTFVNVGNAAWTTELITAFEGNQYGLSTQLRAFLDDPSFWISNDDGGSWVQNAVLPYATNSLTRWPHGGGEGLHVMIIADNDGKWAHAEDPYTTWTDDPDVYGNPPTGGVNMVIVWIL